MANYPTMNQGEMYWQEAGNQQNYYDSDYSTLQNQQLDFQTFSEPADMTSQFYPQSPSVVSPGKPFMASTQYPEMFTPEVYDQPNNQDGEFDEPPLLEELEIYPDRIMEKTLAVLNPFRSHSLADDAEFLSKDTDLAGPVAFCLALAVCLFVSGNKAPFGYIYGLSVVSCIMMYMLLTLMTPSAGIFTLTTVASILGYCLLPVVVLSVLGVFISLHSSLGILIAIMAVIWSSLSTSRLFVTLSGDNQQRPLIAYPCALVYGVFALLVVF